MKTQSKPALARHTSKMLFFLVLHHDQRPHRAEFCTFISPKVMKGGCCSAFTTLCDNGPLNMWFATWLTTETLVSRSLYDSLHSHSRPCFCNNLSDWSFTIILKWGFFLLNEPRVYSVPVCSNRELLDRNLGRSHLFSSSEMSLCSRR